MRHPVEAFSITCNRCGVQFEDGDYTIFCADSDLYFPDHDWWEREAQGQPAEHYCPRCYTANWPTDEEYAAGAEDEMIRTVKPIPDPHPPVRDPRYTRPTPGETCLAQGCGLRADHAVHTQEVAAG